MDKIKTYNQFCNEEINWKKAVTGAALSAGLSIGAPIKGQVNISEPTEKLNILELKPSSSEINPMTIKNSDSLISLDISKFYNIESIKNEEAKLHFTLAYSGNIPQVPSGGVLFVHLPKVSFYISFNTNISGDIHTADIGVETINTQVEDISDSETKQMLVKYGNSIHSNTSIYQIGTWGNEYRGKGTKVTKTTDIKTTKSSYNKLFNLGVAKTIYKNASDVAYLKSPKIPNYMSSLDCIGIPVEIKAYAGLGIFKQVKETEVETHINTIYQDLFFAEDTWHVINPPSYLYSVYGNRYQTDISKTVTTYEYYTKFNINAGLLFTFGYTSLGIGFDTSPAGLEIMAGFTIGRK